MTDKVLRVSSAGNTAPSSTAPASTAAGVKPQKLPMIRTEQANQGYQLFALPAGQGADGLAASIIATGGYGFLNPVQMSGTCFLNGACGVGSGGMDHNVSRIPYAEQASLEINRHVGKELAIDLAYLFVSAHRPVRGNH